MSSRACSSDTAEGHGLHGCVAPLALDLHADDRGVLTAFDFGALPFQPRRVFTVGCVPPGTERGKHGHKTAAHILVCLQGRVEIDTDVDGDTRRFLLQPDGHGLLIGPGVWALQRYLDASSLLLVLASEPYDPDGYIR